jgi:FkbM family methyltransferase
LQGLRNDSQFGRLVAQTLGDRAFSLINIGAADGLERGWRVFGAALRALGVVDLTDATPQLGAEEAAVVRYIHQPLRQDDARGPWRTDPFPRLSVQRSLQVRAERAAGLESQPLESWVRAVADAPRAVTSPIDTDHVEAFNGAPSALETAIEAEGFGDPDFLHLDAGNGDYDILRGLGGLLAQPSLLGIAVRVWMFGSHNAQDNTFNNMDRLLREKGFDLFGLHPVQYSVAALPSPYLDKYPAATLSGRPIYAQAIYLRDLAQPENKTIAAGLSAASLAKASALFALFGLPDLAAELLLIHRERLAAAGLNVDDGLDSLALQAQEDMGTAWNYRDYTAAFDAGAPLFFDTYTRRASWMTSLTTSAREAPVRIAHLERVAGKALTDLYEAQRGKFTAAPDRADPTDQARIDISRRGLIHPDHHWVFDHFRRFSGSATADFYLDTLGTRTRPEFVSWGAPVVQDQLMAQFPGFDEEYFEWTDILQAVLDSGPHFTMLELGAGYGRWSSRAALAARQLGKTISLGLAEAEPRHQKFLRQHMADNEIAQSEYKVFDTAVAGSAGEVVFAVTAPASHAADNWFGQASMPQDLKGSLPIGEYHGQPLYKGHGGWGCIVVPQAPLSAVLEPFDFVDIADFDLQGAEAETLAEGLEPLTRKVRRLHIGTHGHDIEAELRSLLPSAGWVCLRDYACHKDNETPFGSFRFVDGVQTWVNPKLL